MSDNCSDLNGSLVRSVALVIDLGKGYFEKRGDLVEQVLKDEKVRLALHEAFREMALKLVADEARGKPTTASERATALVTKIGKAAGPAAETAVKAQDEWKSAEQGLRELKCAFDKTPVGVFVDHNRGWLIFAGVLVGAGSAAVMYKTRTGDVPAAGLAKIGEMLTKKIEIGSVTFDTKGLNFVPSKREIGGGVGISLGNLEAVKTRFEISAVVDGKTLKALSVSDEVSVPLATGVKLVGKGGVGVLDAKPTYNLNLDVKYGRKGLSLDLSAYVKGEGTGETVGLQARAGYTESLDKTLGKGSYWTAGAMGKVEGKRADPGSSFNVEGTVTLGLGVTF